MISNALMNPVKHFWGETADRLLTLPDSYKDGRTDDHVLTRLHRQNKKNQQRSAKKNWSLCAY
jgi:hypothetical protein